MPCILYSGQRGHTPEHSRWRQRHYVARDGRLGAECPVDPGTCNISAKRKLKALAESAHVRQYPFPTPGNTTLSRGVATGAPQTYSHYLKEAGSLTLFTRL